MMQVVIPVDKDMVQAQKVNLYSCISVAKKVTVESSFATVRQVEAALNKAKGIFETLSVLELLDDFSVTQEDIDRIEAKIHDILDQKRMKNMIRRH